MAIQDNLVLFRSFIKLYAVFFTVFFLYTPNLSIELLVFGSIGSGDIESEVHRHTSGGKSMRVNSTDVLILLPPFQPSFSVLLDF